MLPLQYKIYPLDPTDLSEIKKQITQVLKENKIQVSDSVYSAPIIFAKKRMDNYIYALIIML